MESIKKIFKIGNGPSSSHTMGPKRAAEIFAEKNSNADSFKVYLYGSLALTGKGHMTDYIILKTLPKPTEIIWKNDESLPLHPNGMVFEAYDKDEKKLNDWEVYSVGGGELMDKNSESNEENVYPQNTMADIISYLEKNGGTLWEYVLEVEGESVIDYMKEVWEAMKDAIHRGLEADGTFQVF